VNTDTGACFTGEYSGAQIIKNDGTKGLFKAKAK